MPEPARRPNRSRAGDDQDLRSEMAEMWGALDHIQATQTRQHEMMSDIHRAVMGSADGTIKGLHRRLDAFESNIVDLGERMLSAEDTIEKFDAAREASQADRAALNRRVEELERAQGESKSWLKGIGLAAAAGLVSQFIRMAAELLQAGAHATPPHH